MTDLIRLSARLFNTPLLIVPDTAATIVNALALRLGVEPFEETALSAALSRLRERAGVRAGLFDDDGDEPPDPGYTVDNGVATIPIWGELVNRGSWVRAASGLTSYESLASTLAQVGEDSKVKGVVLDIDSPGGEASGAMETAALVRALAAKKPVVAYVNSMAASAAYALASGATEIVTPPSGSVGSIGVVWMHLDRSAVYAKAGVKPTFIHAGAYKVDGNSMQPLADEVKARIQASVDDVYGLFLSTVGAHRPDLGANGARKTEAAMFMGEKAVAARLADRVGTMDTARSRARPSTSNLSFAKGSRMSDEPIFTQSAHDAAVANAVAAARRDTEAANVAAIAEATRAGATEERARIAAILDGDAGKGRPQLARHFALFTDMSPTAAAAALAAAAPEGKAASRMDQVPNPALRPGATQTEVQPQAAIDESWGGLVGKFNKSKGVRPPL